MKTLPFHIVTYYGSDKRGDKVLNIDYFWRIIDKCMKKGDNSGIKKINKNVDKPFNGAPPAKRRAVFVDFCRIIAISKKLKQFHQKMKQFHPKLKQSHQKMKQSHSKLQQPHPKLAKTSSKTATTPKSSTKKRAIFSRSLLFIVANEI
ncbi:hypothetical protein [Niallia sp. 03133]|uniref:hypothetical protein n=1 Tax=Niallia sp. 03133 TaxID=3458060 RepID=UPI0040444496